VKRHQVAYVLSFMDTTFFLKSQNFKTAIAGTANNDLLAHQNIDYTEEVALIVYKSNCESLRAPRCR